MRLHRRALPALALLAAGPARAAFDRPLVIAHRGASQYLPEHTLAAYRLAIEMGADFIEPDLLLTRDGVPVARHDRSLNATTDALALAARDPAFAARGARLAGGGLSFHTDELDFAELARLNATSRGGPAYAPPEGNAHFTPADRFPIPRFGEVLDLLRDQHARTGQVIGVYPEVKTLGGGLNDHNRTLAEAMLAELAHPRHDGLFDGTRHNVILQSFDLEIVRHLSARSPLPVVFLTGVVPTAPQLAAIRGFARGVGVNQRNLDAEGAARVRAAGLWLHVYTLSNAQPELHEAVYALGADGIFTNAPDTARAARDRLFPRPG